MRKYKNCLHCGKELTSNTGSNVHVDCLGYPNNTMMRVDKDLLKTLKAKKLAKRESYADVVRRMIDKELRGKK